MKKAKHREKEKTFLKTMGGGRGREKKTFEEGKA